MVAAGRRHVMMGAASSTGSATRTSPASATGPGPKAQLLGVRGAPGNTINHPTSYWVPRHSPRVFVERVDMVCGVGYDRAAGLARASPVPRAARGGDQPGRAGLRDPGPRHAAALGASRRDGGRRRRRHRLPAGRPGRGARRPGCPRPRAGADPRTGCDPDGASATGEVPGARRDPHPADRACSASAAPIVQTGMGYVSGAGLAAATSRRAGWASSPSATMSPAELRTAIKAGTGTDRRAVRREPARRRRRTPPSGST